MVFIKNKVILGDLRTGLLTVLSICAELGCRDYREKLGGIDDRRQCRACRHCLYGEVVPAGVTMFYAVKGIGEEVPRRVSGHQKHAIDGHAEQAHDIELQL